MKLNLGCGSDIRKGYINSDRYKLQGVDVVFDIDEPFPFPDNYFDEIIAYNVLEHSKDIMKVMKEIYRVSKKGCIIKILVPHFTASGSYGDLTHHRTFSYNSFNYFDKDLNKDYQEGKFFGYEYNCNFKIIKKKITFRKAFYLFDKLFNLMPEFYEGVGLVFLFPARSIYLELRR